MTDQARLESIAQQLAARIRDEDPERVWVWFACELPDPADWFRIAFVLAAAIPDNQKWSRLVEWIEGTPLERRRRQLREAQARSRSLGRMAA